MLADVLVAHMMHGPAVIAFKGSVSQSEASSAAKGDKQGRLHPYLELLEVCAHAPALVIGQGVAVLLEQGVDTGDATVPRVLQILQHWSSSAQSRSAPINRATPVHQTLTPT